MKSLTQKLTSEIDKLLAMADGFQKRYDEEKHTIKPDLLEDLHYFHTRVVFVLQTLKKQSELSFMNRFKNTHLNLNKTSFESFTDDMIFAKTFLKTAKRELDEGLLYSASDLIKAEVFANFLDYARHLLDGGYKDAAAVMIGGVLEEQLRNGSVKNGLPITKSNGDNLTIAPMNDNLYNGGYYNLLTKNQITAYATIRNDAAHGNYSNYQLQDVEDMYKYALNFSI